MIKILYFVFTALVTILMHFWCYGSLAAYHLTRSEQFAKRPDTDIYSFLFGMVAIDGYFNIVFAHMGITAKKIEDGILFPYTLFRDAIFLVILLMQENSNLLIGQFMLDIMATSVFNCFSEVIDETVNEVSGEEVDVEKRELIPEDKHCSAYAKFL
ncbi:hypothetical protein L5515_018295 [Caenorhabditis briggsae]|uniref:Uncharacterized protein n=1 Tax=Caenorhabditis briggsae TaxID=6238 RepID=A0AAE9JRD7_CAEBR|nr:hypothetical protein L5515_018295 [Caenorhabditis briggsae]